MSRSRYILGGGRNFNSVRGSDAYSMTQLKKAAAEFVSYTKARRAEGFDSPPVHHLEVAVAYPELTEERNLEDLAQELAAWLREGELKETFRELKTVGYKGSLAASSGGGFRTVDLSNALGSPGYVSALALAAGNLRGITTARPEGIPREQATQAFVELNLDQEVVPIMTWWGALFRSLLETTRPEYARLLSHHAADTRAYALAFYSGAREKMFDAHRLENVDDILHRERPPSLPFPLSPVETAPISNGRSWLWLSNQRPNDEYVVEIAGLGLGIAAVRASERDFTHGHEAEAAAIRMAEEMAGKKLWEMDIVQTHAPFSAVPAAMLDYVVAGKYEGAKDTEDALREGLIGVEGKDMILDALLGPVFGHIIDGTTLALIGKMHQWLTGQREFTLPPKLARDGEMWGAVFGVGGLHSMDAVAILRASRRGDARAAPREVPHIDRDMFEKRAVDDLQRASQEGTVSLPPSSDDMLLVALAVAEEEPRRAALVTPARGRDHMCRFYPVGVDGRIRLDREMLGKTRISLGVGKAGRYLEIVDVHE